MQLRYITGRGGRIDRGLSAYLATLTRDYKGLAADSKLLSLSIDEQVQRVIKSRDFNDNIVPRSPNCDRFLHVLNRAMGDGC